MTCRHIWLAHDTGGHCHERGGGFHEGIPLAKCVVRACPEPAEGSERELVTHSRHATAVPSDRGIAQGEWLMPER